MSAELLDLALSLDNAGREVDQNARVVVSKYLALVRNSAMDLSPYRTGFLRGSIHYQLMDGGLSGIVTPSAYYAHFLEFGTVYLQPPRRFMKPALDLHTEGFVKAIEDIGVINL